MKTLARWMLVGSLGFQLSCGTLLYPERRGRASTGRIDPGAAVMDSLWILVFIIPGVVAWVVDLATGAIYLHPGERHLFSSGDPSQPVASVAAGQSLRLERPREASLEAIEFTIAPLNGCGKTRPLGRWESQPDFTLAIPPDLPEGDYRLGVIAPGRPERRLVLHVGI